MVRYNSNDGAILFLSSFCAPSSLSLSLSTIKMRGFLLPALASSAVAQYSSNLLPSNPGGAIPADTQAPSISGFTNATVHPSRGGLAICVSGYVPVKASSSENIKFNFDIPANQSQVTETWLDFTTSGSTFAEQIMGGKQSVSGTYDIYATLCVPANDTAPGSVQLLTHGVGFDSSYWDFAPGYSYVDVATIFGYASFFYDRLSVGQSSKPAPLDVQTPLELSILHELAAGLRQGQFSNATFKTVVGAGHSYGSILTQALTATYPSDLDAAVLTGFSVNSSAMPTFTLGLNLAIAAQNQPYRFSDLSNGYLVSDTAISLQTGFFRAPGFDPNILWLADATKGTVTFGELFSTTAVTAPAKNFTGPVAVVDGAEDLPFCFGNCSYPTNQAQAVFAKLYPNVPTSKQGAYLAPVTGHGLNLHYSAVEAYYYAQNFLKKNGL